MNQFRRILIANRGEIAVRILRTCRRLGIETIALYTADDQDSLHVRLADQSILLTSLDEFTNTEAILQIAQTYHADAVHPGYGFLAERPDFIRACRIAGIAFIGPPVEVVEAVIDKIFVLERVREAGFPVIEHSRLCFNEFSYETLEIEAERLGYPLVIKSSRGGRGRGERMVLRSEQLRQAALRAQAESQAVYGHRSVYLEKAILPAHQVNVQILGDQFGTRVHLGEREGSVILGNQKLFEESPAPCLKPAQRMKLWKMALELAELLNLQNAAAVEFLVDSSGELFFTEVKTRIQVEHPLTEMITRLDLVSEQIRLAAGDRLGYNQQDIHLSGSAMECRITAEDPWMGFMPSPGKLRSVRLPGGSEVRMDTFVYSGCEISPEYDSLVGKLITWGPDRASCLLRIRRALDEFNLIGIPTNIPLLQTLLADTRIDSGRYNISLGATSLAVGRANELLSLRASSNGKKDLNPDEMILVDLSDEQLRDLAIAAAIHYLRRNQIVPPERPERLKSRWHQQSRRLPE
jgi:acetyl-CoA carboxylase biotin carboxylase subunit